MDDCTLYETILGLPRPWRVVDVAVEPAREEVLVRLELEPDATLTCPECGERAPGYDRSPERRWRHLDTCQYRTLLSAEIPRVACPEHGVRQVSVPWAGDRSRFTALFEAMAIRLLQETTLSGLARLMGLRWDEADGILERAVTRGLARRSHEPLRFLGIDETSFQKRHEYVTIVADLERERVVWVGDHRRRATLDAFWAELPEANRAEIEEVVMDMWQPYIQSTSEALPSGSSKIVIDRFHVAQHLNRAVDRTRRAEHLALSALGDERLKKTRFIWIKGGRKRKLSEELRIGRLRRSGLKVERAWALKEAIRKLWSYRSRTWALKFFHRWYAWAVRSRLPEMIQSARMMKRHLPWILNYLRFRHTNALTEGLNAKIQEIKYRARGYRNRDNFRRAILFHCGDLAREIPAAVAFRDLIPEVRLGQSVVELEAARPGFEIWTDGSYAEMLRTLTIRYHFIPKADSVPPTRWARLRAVESREMLRDSATRWSAWKARVRGAERRRGLAPRCLLLGGPGASIGRAEFADTLVISVSAEMWRDRDGQGLEAYLVTRVGEGELEHAGEAGLRSLEVGCSDLESGS